MARRKEPRHLSDAEHALWRRVAETTAPLHPLSASVPPFQPLKPPVPHVVPARAAGNVPSTRAIPVFRIGEHATPATAVTPPTRTNSAGAPVAMDKHAFGRMMRGRLKPEARIDLHGMTLAEAHPALSGFILRAAGQGRRLVLVITGKGRKGVDIGPIPVRRGVLRHQVPLWLATPPLKALVLEVAEAHASHGGGGALYVYLSRAR